MILILLSYLFLKRGSRAKRERGGSGLEQLQRLFCGLALGEGDIDPAVRLAMFGGVIGKAGLGVGNTLSDDSSGIQLGG